MVAEQSEKRKKRGKDAVKTEENDSLTDTAAIPCASCTHSRFYSQFCFNNRLSRLKKKTWFSCSGVVGHKNEADSLRILPSIVF